MRIVHYCRHALAGQSGVANSARGWSEALARGGEDVALVVDAADIRMGDVAGVQTVGLPHLRTGPVVLPQGFGAAIRDADLVVLHGGWHPANNLASQVARRVDVPAIVLTHGVYYPAALDRGRGRKQLWAWAFERRMLRRAAALHLLFEEERAGLDRLGVTTPLVVAPNGVDDPPAGQQWDGGTGGHLLYLGRYDPVHKGLDLLLRGLAAMPTDERPHLRMHGPDWHGGRASVQSLVDDLDLTDGVTVGGPIYGDEKWALLRTAVGLALTSRWEAAPMTLGEAAAIGLPALVTGYPMGRLLAARGAAVLVEPHPAAVAAGLRTLLQPAGGAVGQRARDFVRRELTWTAVAESWLDQVRQLPALSRTGG